VPQQAPPVFPRAVSSSVSVREPVQGKVSAAAQQPLQL